MGTLGNPTPKEEHICGKKATLFRDGERPIYLLEDGRFAFYFDSNWKTFGSIAGVEKSLAVTLKLKPLKIMKESYYEEEFRILDAVAFKELGPIDKDGKRHLRGNWILYNQEILKAQVEYAKIKKEADKMDQEALKAYRKIRDKLGVSITRYNFTEHQGSQNVE